MAGTPPPCNPRPRTRCDYFLPPAWREWGHCDACAWLLWHVRIRRGCWALGVVLCRSWKGMVSCTACPDIAWQRDRSGVLCNPASMAAAHCECAPVRAETCSTHAPGAQVGSQFVQQFYTVLHSSPKYLHRFYTNASTMTHADAERSPPEFTVQSQDVSPRRLTRLRWLQPLVATASADVLPATDTAACQRPALSRLFGMSQQAGRRA